MDQFRDIFIAGWTHLIQHDVKTPSRVIIRQHSFCVPEACCQAIKEEMAHMIQEGIIKESTSPIIAVSKPDWGLWLCYDFLRLNQVAEFDCYPLPQMDSLFNCFGRALFISTLPSKEFQHTCTVRPAASRYTLYLSAVFKGLYNTNISQNIHEGLLQMVSNFIKTIRYQEDL